jgi:hypothetical protein
MSEGLVMAAQHKAIQKLQAERDALAERVRGLETEPPQELLDKWFANELHDFNMILSHLTETYCHFSGGRISKPNTLPMEVFREADDIQMRDTEEAVKEETELLTARVATLEKALREIRDYEGSASRWTSLMAAAALKEKP